MASIPITPPDGRLKIRCGKCSLVQFLPVNGLCLRCKYPFKESLISPQRDVLFGIRNAVQMVRLKVALSAEHMDILAGLAPGLCTEIEQGIREPSILALEKIAVVGQVKVSRMLLYAEDPLKEPWDNSRIAYNNIGAWISCALKGRRKEAGLTLGDLAKRLHLNGPADIREIEAGKRGTPTLFTLKRFSVPLKTTVSNIVADAETEARTKTYLLAPPPAFL
jgi:DNA-binding XRE family transcriptional regulator